MTPEQFVYWLQGFVELTGEPLTKREQIIKDHLKQVFCKKTPDHTDVMPNTVTLPLDQFGQNKFIC